MSDSIELIYFDVQGRGFVPRILLTMSGLEWTDTLVPTTVEAWQKHKPEWNEIAVGQVPILKVNGVAYSHTYAIAEFLAVKAGVSVEDPILRMKVRMIQETLNDITNRGFFTVFGQELMKAYKNPGSGTAEEREERNKKLFPIAAQAMIKFVADGEKVVKKFKTAENSKYLFGDQLTLADLDCLKCKVLMDDPVFNKYADFKLGVLCLAEDLRA